MFLKKFMKRVLFILGPALLAQTASHAAGSYPDHAIKMILPYSAGSGGDSIGRLLADYFSKKLGQPVIVENRVGASGTIGAAFAAKAPNDGYTITIGATTTHAIAPFVFKNLPYDPIRDFTPIGRIGTSGIVFVATPDFKGDSLQDFVREAARNKEPVQYGSWGPGSTGQLCGELLAQSKNIVLEHIPYKGTSDVVTAVMGAQIKYATLDMASATPVIRSGKAKALGICGDDSPSLPGVKSYVEQGIATDVQPSWFLLAPARLPQPIVARLTAVLEEALASNAVADRLLAFGIKPAYLDPQDTAINMTTNIAAWRDVAKRAKIEPQ